MKRKRREPPRMTDNRDGTLSGELFGQPVTVSSRQHPMERRVKTSRKFVKPADLVCPTEAPLQLADDVANYLSIARNAGIDTNKLTYDQAESILKGRYKLVKTEQQAA